VLGFTLRGLPTDAEGVLPEAFEAACVASKVTALVLIPTFNNPTATVMGGPRRHAIAGVATSSTNSRRSYERGHPRAAQSSRQGLSRSRYGEVGVFGSMAHLARRAVEERRLFNASF
jgi:hypothetical protein